MADYIIIGLSLITLAFYLVVLFLMFELKLRTDGKLATTFVYMTSAIIILIIVRIMDILSKFGFFEVAYLHESLVVLFSLLLFLAFYNFYKSVSGITDIRSSIKTSKGKNEITKNKKQKKNKLRFRYVDLTPEGKEFNPSKS